MKNNNTTKEIIMNSFDQPQSDSSNFEEMEIYRNEIAAIREIEMIESETDHQFDLQQDGWIFNIWASSRTPTNRLADVNPWYIRT